jgi:hypothetical protein
MLYRHSIPIGAYELPAFLSLPLTRIISLVDHITSSHWVLGLGSDDSQRPSPSRSFALPNFLLRDLSCSPHTSDRPWVLDCIFLFGQDTHLSFVVYTAMPVPSRATKVEAKYNVTTECELAESWSWLHSHTSISLVPQLGLHFAAATGNIGLVQYALSHGQPINSVLDGVLPLHAACSGGNDLVVKLLIDHGADVNAPRYEFICFLS